MPLSPHVALPKRKTGLKPTLHKARLFFRFIIVVGALCGLFWASRATPTIVLGALQSAPSTLPSKAKAVVAMLKDDDVDFSAPPGLTLREAEVFASNNMGNIMWRYAARRLFDSESTDIVFVNSSIMPWNMPKDCQLLCLPVANLIQERDEFVLDPIPYSNVLTGWIRDVGVPVAIVGLGLQAPFKGQTIHPPDVFVQNFQIHEDQAAFLKQLAMTSSILTVRGAHTRAVADHNGNSQAAPLGCPTLFINHDLNLGKSIQQKLEAIIRARKYDVRVAVTLPWLITSPAAKETAKETMQQTERLLRWLTQAVFLKFPNSFVVLQSHGDYGTLRYLQKLTGFKLPEQRMAFFYDVPAWISAMEACDVAVHFRIHGTMATIAAGTPSVIISTDYRVEELAEVMRLPRADIFHRHFEATNPNPDMFELMASLPTPFSGTEFDANRARIAHEYITLFHNAGIRMHEGIRQIADSSVYSKRYDRSFK